MNTSRVAAAAAALAIGFGVTLAGVAIGDDSDDSDVSEVAVVDDGDAVDQEPTPVDDPDQADVESPSSSAPGDDPSELDESVGDVGQVGESEQEPATTQVVQEQPSTTVVLPTNPVDTVAAPVDPFDDVRCVPTISVLLITGEQLDLVVESSEGATAWRVLDADGSFIISRDDRDVADVVEVLRNVRFFQGAPVNFFDVCDEVGRVLGENSSAGDSASDSRDSGEDASNRARFDFPCSDRAQAQMRLWLLDDEVAALDDIGEMQLALAVRLDGVDGRDIDAWLFELETELVGFRGFDGGCPDALENGFTFDGIFCAATRISADDDLLTYFDTVMPAAMSDCTYEPDQNGEF